MLVDRGAKTRPVEGEQQIALAHPIALAHVQVIDAAGHIAADLDLDERAHGARRAHPTLDGTARDGFGAHVAGALLPSAHGDGHDDREDQRAGDREPDSSANAHHAGLPRLDAADRLPEAGEGERQVDLGLDERDARAPQR